MPETFPSAINRLGRLVEEADGTLTETLTIPSSAPYQHALGTALTPAAMAGVPVIPRGAVPISPPAAPSVGTGNPVTGPGGLTPNNAYAWRMVNVSDFGETPAGPALVVASIGAATSYRVGLPNPLEGTADAPIRRRRLYRTAAGGGAAGPFGLGVTLDELATTSYVDTLADIDLGPPPSAANTSGLPPVVSVTYVSGGVGALTEAANGTTLTTGTYSCDYSLSSTGGVLSFASGDAGRAVVVTYVAASLANKTVMATLIAGQQQMVAALGAANGVATLGIDGLVVQDPESRGQQEGLATLDVHLHVAQSGPNPYTTGQVNGVAALDINRNVIHPPLHGVRQTQPIVQRTDQPALIAAGWNVYPDPAFQNINITISPGGVLRARLSGWAVNQGNLNDSIGFRVAISANGVVQHLYVGLGTAGNSLPTVLAGCDTPLTPVTGVVNCSLEFQTTGGREWQIRAYPGFGTPGAGMLTLEFDEIA